GERHYVIYNPPMVDAAQGIRRGVVLETSGIAKRFIKEGIPTIIFARSRMNTEVILSYLKKWIPSKSREIAGYRGGYLPKERREIERGLKNGRIRAVVATNALELGVDIGGLDVSIMAGYPGTVASFYQQSGRSGRKERISLAILVASNSPLDQYIAEHPEYLIEKSPEAALINPKNVFILVDQLKCAAFELPFKENEGFIDEEVGDILNFLEEKSVLHRENDIYHWQERSYPAENVSIRSADDGNFVIVEMSASGRRVIGEMDRSSVPFLLYKNAVYIHGSQQYVVTELDWDNRVAYVKMSKVNYYTDSESKTDIKILENDEYSSSGMYDAWLSEVLVRTMAVKYKKIKFGTHENIGWGEINLPTIEMHTRSLVLALNNELFGNYSREQSENLLLSISNLLRNISPLYIMTDVRDIGSAEALKEPLTGRPTLFLYDRYPGGVGLADRLFDVKDSLLVSALQRVKECACSNGCPSCVGPNRMNKRDTIEVLEHLIKGNVKLVN
ncbi:MAG: ATP-dependent helicase, partial [Spirochaetes bacterium]